MKIKSINKKNQINEWKRYNKNILFLFWIWQDSNLSHEDFYAGHFVH